MYSSTTRVDGACRYNDSFCRDEAGASIIGGSVVFKVSLDGVGCTVGKEETDVAGEVLEKKYNMLYNEVMSSKYDDFVKKFKKKRGREREDMEVEVEEQKRN